MKDRLISCVENQLDNISAVDTKELGEAVDMIKDLEETIYYATVTKAMNEYEREPEQEMERMYFPSGRGGRGSGGNNARGGGSRGYGYYEPYYYYDMDRMYYNGGGSGGSGGSGGNSGGGSSGRGGSRGYQDFRDYREGRSGSSRRNYMESKEMHDSKEKQMRELENYMRELNQDVMEMINDASPEEKQILSQKLSTLAEKIK